MPNRKIAMLEPQNYLKFYIRLKNFQGAKKPENSSQFLFPGL